LYWSSSIRRFSSAALTLVSAVAAWRSACSYPRNACSTSISSRRWRSAISCRVRAAANSASLTPAFLILGSIIGGVATATEAGALAVVYSFCLGFFFYRELKPKHLWPVLVRTFRTVLMVFFLIGASGAFGYVMTILRLPDIITQGFLSISDRTWVILLMINILLLILGGPMDMAPMIVILTPILLPVCVKLGMDPVQFGLVLIFNAGMGLLTPPVGTVLFVGCAIGKISVNAGTKAMMPFFLAMIVVLFLITYYTPFTMWLPTFVK